MILREDETVTKSENNNPSQPRNESKDSKKLVPKETFYNNFNVEEIAKSKIYDDSSLHLYLLKLSLKNHTIVIHDKMKLFLCQICQHNFGFKQRLKRHFPLIHEKT